MDRRLEYMRRIFIGRDGKAQLPLEEVGPDSPWADVVTEGSIVGHRTKINSHLKKKLESHGFAVVKGFAVLPPEHIPEAPVRSLPSRTAGEFYENNLLGQDLFTDPDAMWFYEREDVPDLAYQGIGKMLLDVTTETWPEAGGHYVELHTRIGTMVGSGESWSEATARALAAFHEVRRRVKYEIKLIDQATANAFVDMVHRHHRRPQGDKFRLGAYAVVNNVRSLVGVVVVSLARNRHLAAQGAWEVTRLAVSEQSPNLCSKLYAAAWKEARKRGCKRMVTFILLDEPGTTLKAVGWDLVVEEAGGGSWDRETRHREDKHPTELKQRWEVSDPVYQSVLASEIPSIREQGFHPSEVHESEGKAREPDKVVLRLPWPVPATDDETKKGFKFRHVPPDRIQVKVGKVWQPLV